MKRGFFWLGAAQIARIEPHLPRDTRGKPHVDDRRVISGIVHILKSGGRWIDAPSDYRPRKTHALTECDCRPIAFLLTCGPVGDCVAGSTLLEQMPPHRYAI